MPLAEAGRRLPETRQSRGNPRIRRGFERMKYTSAFWLRTDLAVAFVLLTIAKAGRLGSPNPDVGYYLGDRYWWLAAYYERRGHAIKAKRLRDKAEHYLRASGWWHGGPPPSGALAMPVPKRPTFTAAIGWRARRGPPDDAA